MGCSDSKASIAAGALQSSANLLGIATPVAKEDSLASLIDNDQSGEAELSEADIERCLAEMPDDYIRKTLDQSVNLTIVIVDAVARDFARYPPSFNRSYATLRFAQPPKMKQIAVDGKIIIQLPDDDEDASDMLMVGRALLCLVQKLPLDDRAPYTESPKHSLAMLAESPLMRLLPTAGSVWPELHSDRALVRIAFCGMLQYYMQGVDKCKAPCEVPAGSVACIDFSDMVDLPVRAGFETMGACAFFGGDGPDADRRTLLAIWWSHSNRLVLPGDGEWEHAKFAFKGCYPARVAVVEHLSHTHWTVANGATSAARIALGPTHPLRRFLRPFCFRSAKINDMAAQALLPECGFVHRAISLDYQGLCTLLGRGLGSWRYLPFPAFVASKGLPPDVERSLPMVEDGLELWAVLSKFTAAFVDVFYESDAALLRTVRPATTGMSSTPRQRAERMGCQG